MAEAIDQTPPETPIARAAGRAHLPDLSTAIRLLIAGWLALIAMSILGSSGCVRTSSGVRLSPGAAAAFGAFAECGPQAAAGYADARQALHDGAALRQGGKDWASVLIDFFKLALDAGGCARKIIAAERAAHAPPPAEELRLTATPVLARVAELSTLQTSGDPPKK